MTRNIYLSSALLCIFLGCHLPPRIDISSSQFSKKNVETIKKIIRNEAYTNYDNTENVPHCVDYSSFVDCYYLTRYTKEFYSSDADKRLMYIGLSFKIFNYPSDYYRNFNISLSPSRTGDPDLDAELVKMENIIFKSVSDISGGNVNKTKH
jgi:hypothetical protein